MYMKANDIRKSFLDFFESKQHYVKNSFSLVPKNDKSLLLINAGMAPLKNYFLGLEEPPSKRMSTCQKCVRTGDIDNIGLTLRHATFFEMLGNFSFGDYFKKEAITYAWEFVTKVLKMDDEKLWVTVYEDDDEAYDLWNKMIGVDESRIVRLGKEDNFWEIGNGQGPCGPCSEIYIDRGEKYKCDNPDCKPGCDCDRFLEFWNLVFTQFDRQADGSLKRLAHPNIDTGMGLERIACIMQGVDSIFDIDTMVEIRNKISEISGRPYNENHKDDISIRIVADHLRAITFMVNDGIIPSNEGRGYVLRRLARRAVRHGKLLGIKGKFICDIVDIVIDVYKDGYEDLEQNRGHIKAILGAEEEKFGETLQNGLDILSDYIQQAKDSNNSLISGEDAFKLYDTFGFPLELTVEIASEKDCKVDTNGFELQMQKQKETARGSRKSGSDVGWKDEITSLDLSTEHTEFLGYERLDFDTRIQDIVFDGKLVDELNAGDEAVLIFENTPFYAESGGQIGDTGKITSGNFDADVVDVTKSTGGLFLHKTVVKSGKLKKGDNVHLSVDRKTRLATMRNHTATHLLHKALKEVVGEHINQSGSYVSPDGLRFDFNHYAQVTKEQLQKVERLVNEKIYESIDVTTDIMDIESAKKTGAMSLFDEKYGNMVRVLSVGDFSKEFCGGTHVSNTNQIGMFKIISEGAVSSGVRRVEAITGAAVYDYMTANDSLIDDISIAVKSNRATLEKRIESLVEENRSLAKLLKNAQNESAKGDMDGIIKSAVKIGDISLMIGKYEDVQDDVLRGTMQGIIDKVPSSIIVFSNVDTSENKLKFICMVDKKLNPKYHAGKIIKEVSQVAGGNGGGKPNLAQAGGKDISKIDEALSKAKDIISNM